MSYSNPLTGKKIEGLARVNDMVLALFLPCHDSDGYILGRIEEDTNLI